jgi:hypothetical protein
MEREAEEKFYRWRKTRRSVTVIIRLRRRSVSSRAEAVARFRGEFNCTSWAQFLLKWIVAHRR